MLAEKAAKAATAKKPAAKKKPSPEQSPSGTPRDPNKPPPYKLTDPQKKMLQQAFKLLDLKGQGSVGREDLEEAVTKKRKGNFFAKMGQVTQQPPPLFQRPPPPAGYRPCGVLTMMYSPLPPAGTAPPCGLAPIHEIFRSRRQGQG